MGRRIAEHPSAERETMSETHSSPIIASRPLLNEPNWLGLECLAPKPCAEAIRQHLGALEGAERWVYAMRGELLRHFDSRQLYLEYDDPANGKPCNSTDRFLKVYEPDSWRYLEEALRNRQKTFESIPLHAATKMTRANLQLLEDCSKSVQALPEVQEAAQKERQKQFVKTLNKRGQHVEERVRPGWSFTEGEFKEIAEYLSWVASKADLEIDDYPGALLCLSINENKAHREGKAA
jgi:hypothetical protein